MTQISRFIGEVVPVAQRVTGDRGESAATVRGGGFADYALVSLHCLRIYLDTSYRMTIDLLTEMPQIIGEIGRVKADLPAPSTLCKAFVRISMSVCRVLLRRSAQLHDLSEHAAIDATFYDRSPASRHYCQRISYRVQKLKVTKLVDTASQVVLDVHCSTNREGSDTDLAEQIARVSAGDLRSLAADKGYDKQSLREGLRDLGIRPLIKHRIFAPHAHNARINDNRYNQRSMTETVNSAVKRSLGFAANRLPTLSKTQCTY
ncbi:IS5 family transposase [Halorubrum sp. GN11GM_10-3_MGM]|uniref:IS5 family transposase n=1 Tax=Halorubrum sp. GN11GM_10-3_MGM TaxID=2518111 RepID=UPI0010F9005C|nr:IS5 family transposase [Halorubrum sp. GN11GM_10-3_MGM]TKX69198.1 IS5 family transposase [Halorubrum sp. GN11GM_10-3_MGM]